MSDNVSTSNLTVLNHDSVSSIVNGETGPFIRYNKNELINLCKLATPPGTFNMIDGHILPPQVCKRRRGRKGGVRHKHTNSRSTDPVDKLDIYHRPRNDTKHRTTINFGLLNARSVRNKSDIIAEYISDNDIDIMCITETWLTDSDNDIMIRGDICPAGYKLFQIPRQGRGGGVAVIIKDTFTTTMCPSLSSIASLEYLELMVSYMSTSLRLIVVYRPPPSHKNKLTASVFFDEFERLLVYHTTTSGRLFICGDFNFHMNNIMNSDTVKFSKLLFSHNLTQHVEGSTHRSGNTLDLLITRKSESVLQDVSITDPSMSDHSVIRCSLLVHKPPPQKKWIKFRKIRSIDLNAFKEDILDSVLLSKQGNDVSELAHRYNQVLRELLDKHAPLKERCIIVRHVAPWYNDCIKVEKQKRRKLEKKWRSTWLVIDREIYKEQCRRVSKLITEAKRDYLSDKINDNINDQKALFKITNAMLHKNTANKLPSHTSSEDLANMFADYFIDKIKKIQSDLDIVRRATICTVSDETMKRAPQLSTFDVATEIEIKQIIMGSPTKSFTTDPIPTTLFKNCIDTLLPIVTYLINLSLSSGTIPENMNEAVIIPLIKKLIFCCEVLKNADMFPIFSICPMSLNML